MKLAQIKKLTNQELNIEVAKRDGWSGVSDSGWGHCPDPGSCFTQIPYYDRDLNAIHRALKFLEDDTNRNLRIEWLDCIRKCVAHRCPVNRVGSPVISDFDILRASARELSESYVLLMSNRKKEPTP